MDKSLLNIVAFLDLKKAFDTIDHKILIEKLNMYGIKRHSLGLLESYITNQSQKCFTNGTLSHSKLIIKCGIPQGSILGPLFFLVYINDLPNCLKTVHRGCLQMIRRSLCVANPHMKFRLL